MLSRLSRCCVGLLLGLWQSSAWAADGVASGWSGWLVSAALLLLVVWSLVRRSAASLPLSSSENPCGESCYAEIFANIQCGVAVYEAENDGENFRFVAFNPAAEQINRVSRDEVLGRRVTEMFPAVVELGLFEVFQRVYRSGQRETLPLSHYQGETLYRRINNHVYRLSNGLLVAVHEDATEIHASEQEQRRKAVSLDRAQAIAHIGSWEWNIPSGALHWSDEIYRIFGLTPQQFPATYDAFLARVHPDDRQALSDAVAAALADPTVEYRMEHRLVRPDGTERRVLEVGDVTRDAQGQAIFMTGTVQDVTAYKQTESNLLLAQRVIESAGEAIIITDAQGIITDVNPAYERIMGYERHEIIGQNPSYAASGRHDAAFYRDMWSQLNQHGCWEGEIWDRRKSGEIFPQWLTVNAIQGVTGEVSHYVGIFLDISRQKATEEKLEELAFYDRLTGLPNRTLFQNRLRHELKVCKRKGRRLALMFIDLDRFKGVNDTLGHAAGDELLVQLAARLKEELRDMDTLARLGGDEFTVIVSDLVSPHDISALAHQLIKRICEPVVLQGRSVHVGASLGIAIYPDDADEAGTLIKFADMAMYQAKEAGRNNYKYFSPLIQSRVQHRVSMEEDLHQALEQDGFEVYYQPKVQLETRRIIGAEALVRWHHPQRGLVGPDEFIPLAEETGLIMALGALVLMKACMQGAKWHRQGHGDFRLAVNLSARQLHAAQIVDMVRDTLATSGLPAACLELEITESAVMFDVEEAIGIMAQLRELGVGLAIDDFGTGYSSLSYLKRFPITTLKIDKSFVIDVERDADDAAIVDAVISLARSLHLNVVAEGIENQHQLSFLLDRKCFEGQGYLLGRPMPEGDFQQLINATLEVTPAAD